jgi:RNA polymerase sigma factor (sigma-70 family)
MAEPYGSDDELVEGLKEGDQLAHYVFAKRFGPRIKAFIKTISWDMGEEDVKEIANDSTWKVISKISSFDPRRGVRFTTWVYTIVQNTVRDHVQQSEKLQAKFEREFTSYEELLESTGEDPATVEPEVEKENGPESGVVIRLSLGHIIVRQAIKRLTPREQQVIKEHMYGLSNPEIALLLHLQDQAVRTALSRAKTHLQEVCLEICQERDIDPAKLYFEAGG